MRSPNVTYLQGVDHCRAFAATLIVYYHCTLFLGMARSGGSPATEPAGEWLRASNPLAALMIEGHTAVGFFIVLSGFIFAYGAAGREVRYWPFLRNRLLRIYPLFLTLVFLTISAFPKRFDVLGLLATVGALANYPGALGVLPFTVMIWTIGVEMQFYLMFPFLNAHLNREGPRPIWMLIPTAILLRGLGVVGGGDVHMLTYQTIFGRIDQFALGMLAAHLWRSGRIDPATLRRGLLPAIAVVLAVLFGFNRLGGWPAEAPWKISWPTIEGAAWATFLLCYLGATRNWEGRLATLLARIGELSFSMYLLHHPIAWLLVQHGWVIDPGWGRPVAAVLTTTIVALPVVLAVSKLTYTAIERPFLALRGHYLVDAPAPVRGGAAG